MSVNLNNIYKNLQAKALELAPADLQDPFEGLSNVVLDTMSGEIEEIPNTGLFKCFLQSNDPMLKEKLAELAVKNISVLRFKRVQGDVLPAEIGFLTTLRILDLVEFQVDMYNPTFFPEEIKYLTGVPLSVRCTLRNQCINLSTCPEIDAIAQIALISQARILQDWVNAGFPYKLYCFPTHAYSIWYKTKNIYQFHPVLATSEFKRFITPIFPSALKLDRVYFENGKILIPGHCRRVVLVFSTSIELFNLFMQTYLLSYCYQTDPKEGDRFQRQLLATLYEDLNLKHPAILKMASSELKYDDLRNLFVHGKIWANEEPNYPTSFKIFSAWTPLDKSRTSLDYPIASLKKDRNVMVSKYLYT